MEEFVKKVYSKALLVIGIIICLLGILIGGLFYWALSNQEAVYLDRVTEELTYAKVDVDLLDDYFATQKEDTKVLKYYLAYDNQKKPYVVVLNDTHLNFLKDIQDYSLGLTDIKPEALTIYGQAKKIEDKAYELLKDYLGDDEYTYTVDQVKNAVGDYYLDTYYNPDEDINFMFVFSGMIVIVGLVLIIIYVVKLNKSKKLLEKYSDKIEKVLKDVDNGKGIHNKICKVFLSNDYIVGYDTGLSVIEVKDLLWVYQFVMRQNGIVTNKILYGVNKLGKSITITNVSPIIRKQNKALEELYQDMMNMYPDVLYGYSKENKDKVKELTKKK